MADIPQNDLLDKISFEGGMSITPDIRTQKRGTYGYGMNLRKGSSSRNNISDVENILGNTIVANVLPPGFNKCIDTLEDIRNSALIFWNYNSLGHHCIFRYLTASNTVERILYDEPILNFQLNSKIYHSDIVYNGTDELLYWTDGFDATDEANGIWVDVLQKPGNLIVAGNWLYNPPRKINVTKAKTYTANAYTFSDNDFVTGALTAFTGIPSTAGLNVGDIVAVQQFPGYSNPQYNTIGLITQVLPNEIHTNIPYGVNTNPEGGKLIKLPTTGYQGITYQVLDLIKYPPIFSPTAVYATDSLRKKNFFSNKLNQYGYRYRYDDNEVSVLSPLSNITIPVNDDTINGPNVATVSLNNVVYLQLYTGPSIVTKIDIVIRELNTGKVMLIDTIDKKQKNLADNTTYTYLYYNDTVREVLDQTDVVRPFDYVPQVSSCEEIIQKNVLLQAQITEGYGNISPVVSLTPRQEDVNYIVNGLNTTFQTTFVSKQTFTDWKRWEWNIQIPAYTSFFPGAELRFVDSHWGVNVTHTLTLLDLASQAAFNAAVTALIGTVFGAGFPDFYNANLGYGPQPTYSPFAQNSVTLSGNTFTFVYYTNLGETRSGYRYFGTNPIGFNKNGQMFMGVYANSTKVSSFKSGAVHPVGLVYYDRGNRYSAVQKTDLFDVYIPFQVEATPGQGIYQRRNVIDTEISHRPPVWATHYQWVYAGNTSVGAFLQMETDGVIATTGNVTSIPIALTQYNTDNPTSVLAYTFTKGDRCRVVSINGAIPTDYIDGEITSYASSTLSVTNLSSVIPLGTTRMLIEVYTPFKTTTNKLYFTMGVQFEIGNAHLPNRYHKGQVQDQQFAPGTYTLVQPAKTTLSNGDVYMKARKMQFAAGNNYISELVEDYNYSDFYTSDAYNKGLIPIPYDITAKRAKLPFIRWSSPLFENTLVNGLSTFLYTNFLPLTHSYGTINKIVENGMSLKVFQSFKHVSIFIGRTVAEDSGGGNPNILLSTDTLGTITPSENSYGCVLPGSVVKHNSYIYSYDITSGCILRDATNGPYEISKYGLEFFITNLSKYLIGHGIKNIDCVAGYDEEFDEYVITIIDNLSLGKYNQYDAAKQALEAAKAAYASNPSIVNQALLAQAQVDFNIAEEQLQPFLLFPPTITLAFNETDNLWTSFYSFAPEYYGLITQKFISFKDGNLWVHNSGTVYNSFYGGAQAYPKDNAPWRIQAVGNGYLGKQKVFTYLSTFSNKPLEAPTQGDIKIPPMAKYPSGMESRLTMNQFRPLNRTYYAAFLRDMLTPNVAAPKILNGRRLTGEAISVYLQNDYKDYFLLYGSPQDGSVVIHAIPSEKS